MKIGPRATLGIMLSDTMRGMKASFSRRDQLKARASTTPTATASQNPPNTDAAVTRVLCSQS